MNEKEVLNAKETATYLGIHLVTTYRLLKTKILKAKKVGGQWRFLKSDLKTWLGQKYE